MPKRYAREFRRDICERLVAGERVSKISEESGVSPGTLHLWKRATVRTAERAVAAEPCNTPRPRTGSIRSSGGASCSNCRDWP
jgi:transposase-like protein